MSQQRTYAAVDSLYSANRLVREQDGQAVHPDLPPARMLGAHSLNIRPILTAQGFEFRRVLGEMDGNAFTHASLGRCDQIYWNEMQAWNPTPPVGKGWLLAAVLDSIDGPTAWFVRPLSASNRGGSKPGHRALGPKRRKARRRA